MSTHEDSTGLKILIVEDDEDTAASLMRLLHLFGHEARAVYDGPSAVHQARAYVPDVVLLDIGLPGMDGYTVASHLKLQPTLKAPFVVAITGQEPLEPLPAAAAHIDVYWRKPVPPGQLVCILSRFQRIVR